jgi:hypothetical protein
VRKAHARAVVRALPYAAAMPKAKKPGDSYTPRGGSGGPAGKKQRSRARRSRKPGK